MLRNAINRYAAHFNEAFITYTLPIEMIEDHTALKRLVDKCITENNPLTFYYPVEHLTFIFFIGLSRSEQNAAYGYLSDKDKFRARINDTGAVNKRRVQALQFIE